MLVPCQGRRGQVGQRPYEIENKAALRQAVAGDLQLLHNSQTPNEFRAKAKAVLLRWVQEGYASATEWKDKRGRIHTLVSYFESEWFNRCPEWHCGPINVGDEQRQQARDSGLCIPTTNNACESEVKWSRLWHIKKNY